MADEYIFYRETEKHYAGRVAALLPDGTKRSYLSPSHGLDYAEQIADTARIFPDESLKSLLIDDSNVYDKLMGIIYDCAKREDSSKRELAGARA